MIIKIKAIKTNHLATRRHSTVRQGNKLNDATDDVAFLKEVTTAPAQPYHPQQLRHLDYS